MSNEAQAAKKPFWHRLFGTTPGEGVQPKEAIAFSVAGFGQNFICTIIGSYLTIFLTDALLFGSSDSKVGAISGTVAVAYLMLFTRVFDALNDPIMGSIVDRTRTKWGKCRPYLRWMPIPIVVMTLLCFNPFLTPGQTSTFTIISITYVIWSIAYTIVDVPYWGMTSCMTNNTEIRANMLTVARLVCTAGAGLVTVCVPLITSAVTKKYKGPNGDVLPQYIYENASTLKWTYFICAAVLGIAAIPMFLYGFKNTKERIVTTAEPPSLGHNLKLLFKNQPLMMVVLSGILGGGRMAYVYTGGLYFAKYVLHNEALFSIITMLSVPGGLIASILVPAMAKKFTKKWTYVGVHVLGAVVMFGMYFVGYDKPWKLVVCAIGLILTGIPVGVNNIITYAMIGDTVDYLEWKTGERGEGICFAMQTFISKIGMAVGAFVGVFSYSWAKINPTAANGVYFTPEGEKTLWAALILVGALSMLLTIIPILFYPITEQKQREMVAEIKARGNSDVEHEA